MRPRAYFLFALVAWPAAAWGAVEVCLRLATGTTDGLAGAFLLCGCAVLTLVACSWRRRQLGSATPR